MFFARWALIPWTVLGWLIVIGPAAAALTPEIRDDAGFFKAETVAKANAEIKEIKHQSKKDLLIETYKTVPVAKTEQVKKMDKESRSRFFAEWAVERAKAVEVNGIYVLICKDPAHLQVEVGNETRKKAFTDKNRDALRDLLLGRFREAAKVKDEEAKKDLYDKGLVEAVAFVRTTLGANLGKTAAPAAGADPRSPLLPAAEAAQPTWVSSLVGLVCVGLVGLLAVWLVIGIVRALSGAGSPGYAGGGGGFLTGLLGGLFGAAAGMWLYDSFFRGGGWGGSSAYGSEPDSDLGGSAADTDYTGSGSDFGSDAGGDFGGGDFGGGDFGGGDFGGGGDF